MNFETKPIQFSSQIEEVRRNKDRTLRLKIDTQEIPPDEAARIFDLQDKQIWIAMAETPLTQSDLNIPEVVDELDKKSPSQRQRDRIFVYWKEKGIGGNFDDFYKKKLDEHGQKFLDALQ